MYRPRASLYPSAVATVFFLASASKRLCMRSPTAPADATIVQVFFPRSLVWWYSIWLVVVSSGRSSTDIAGHGVSSQNCQSSSFSCSCAHHHSSSESYSSSSSGCVISCAMIWSLGSSLCILSISRDGGSWSRIGLTRNSCTHTAVPITATINWMMFCCISTGTKVTNSWYPIHAIKAKQMSSILLDTAYLFCIALMSVDITIPTVVVIRISICKGGVKLL